MSGLGTDVGHELSALVQTTDSRPRNRLSVHRINDLGVTETDRSAADDGTHTLRWPDRLLYGDGLGRYFSLHHPKDSSSQMRGWRKSVVVAAAVTGGILLTNVVFTIVACVRSSIDSQGVGLVYSGNCDRVKRWNMTLHLLINVLGTIMLAASSFTMQCLSSPTRCEVDDAHAKRVSLEIGVTSLTNLFYLRRWKAIVWLLLCLSSIPLHLLYNSTVFTTLPQNYFSVVVADQSFLQGAAYSQVNDSFVSLCLSGWYMCFDKRLSCSDPIPTDVIESVYSGYKSGRYSSLTAAECLDIYSDTLPSSRRNLIVLVQQPTFSDRMTGCGFNSVHDKTTDTTDADKPVMWNGSSVVGVAMNASTTVLTRKFWPTFSWMEGFSVPVPGLDDLGKEVESTGTWPLGDYRVEACQSENIVSKPCDLQFLPSILYVVVACNVVKVICMCITACFLWNGEEPILASVGDAVSSYLERPDETTRGLCLMDHQDRARGAWQSYNPVYSRKTRRRLYFATTHLRWWTTMVVCASFVITGWFFWTLPLLVAYRTLVFQQSMSWGFGSVDPRMAITLRGLVGNVLVENLVANTFQITLSITYFLYNSLWTAQCGALEWASYIQGKRKALRVTQPSGQQRSTYYLELPYRYGVPLTVVLMLMHFLISQSVFLERTQKYDWLGDRIHDGLLTELGYSPPAILSACIVGTVLILLQVAHACRSFDNRIPTHGNDSVVISAMCHPGRCDENELDSCGIPSEATNLSGIALGPVMWGVTRYPDDSVDSHSMSIDLRKDDAGAGHCSFSADVVELPETGKKYR